MCSSRSFVFFEATGAKALNTGKTALKIVLQIDDRLKPDSNTQQGFGDSRRCTLLGCDAAMRR